MGRTGYSEFCCDRVGRGGEGVVELLETFEMGRIRWGGRRGEEEKGEKGEGRNKEGRRGEENGGTPWLWDFFERGVALGGNYFPPLWTGVCDCGNGVVGLTGYVSTVEVGYVWRG